MKYLVDTNVICEHIKPMPNKSVWDWLGEVSEHDMAISVISAGEMFRGVEKLSPSNRKTHLNTWLNQIIAAFEGRILDINTDIMQTWGNMMAKHPKSLPIQDSLIAATALTYHMTIVTRNNKDFEDIAGLKIFNPWKD